MKVVQFFEDAAITSILHDLIRQTSLPLRTIETTFAPDSTGFCTSRFIRWFDIKYGVTREAHGFWTVSLLSGAPLLLGSAACLACHFRLRWMNPVHC